MPSCDADSELFLPVSYHMNPANYPALKEKTSCTDSELTWYGTEASYKYCAQPRFYR